ncbi:hypothetical protein BC940DRAFT_344070 [Gongronella butleri]|nr:hypothetical protein BC940DRAFT_344070 [Gongronella butleri]
MSSSVVTSAKRKTELSLKQFALPTKDTPDTDTQHLGDQLLLSLCQSRLNWTQYTLPKYVPDSAQQPKRGASVRKRFPAMRMLGRATVHIGPHQWADTGFYQATRVNSWTELAHAAGCPHVDLSIRPNPVNIEHGAPMPHPDAPAPPAMEPLLLFSDITMEFKESPADRIVFPKNSLLQRMTDHAPHEIVVSFMIPLAPQETDAFFWTARKKVLQFAPQCPVPAIQDLAAQVAASKDDTMDSDPPSKEGEDKDAPKTAETHDDAPPPPPLQAPQAVNMRITGASDALWAALCGVVYPPHQVSASMEQEIARVQPRQYLDFCLSPAEEKAIHALVERVYSVPEFLTRPVGAEKKRNEAQFANRKRQAEANATTEGPKTKMQHKAAEDNQWKCCYCSTRHTNMRRPGPDGTSSLCNGCGILWKQGKIFRGKSRARAAELDADDDKKINYDQWLQNQLKLKTQQHQPQQQQEEIPIKTESRESEPPASADPTPEPPLESPDASGKKVETTMEATDLDESAKSNNDAALPLETSTNDNAIGSGDVSAAAAPLPSQAPSAGGTISPPLMTKIPLPTVNIEFAYHTFYHPHCSVSLEKDQFQLHLTRDGDDASPVQLQIPRKALANKHTTLDVLDRISSEADRDLLLMTCKPALTHTLTGFGGIVLLDPRDASTTASNTPHSSSTISTSTLKIRFLENMDPSGQPMVRKILTRWLAMN